MLRLLVILSLLLAAFAWLEPNWNERTRTFSLRVRESSEVGPFLGSIASPLNKRLSALVGGPEEQIPAVAAGSRSSRPEALTEEDRARLDKLIEEKTRGQ